jgi:predicted nuclease of restriction endonuclease-like (RecB) superfamily
MRKSSEKTTLAATEESIAIPVGRETSSLMKDIRSLIESARNRAATAINKEMVMLYWHIGGRIRRDILGNERADYGKQIVQMLSEKLTTEYGRGFTRTNLFNMIRFAEVFPDKEIVHALGGQLNWTHFREIIYLEDNLKRDFYAEMCRIGRWSTRTLRAQIQGMLYERTALSKKSEKFIQQELSILREEDHMTPDLVFRDPYFLDFLGLILCAEKTAEHVELLQLETGGIRVAEYLTELPPRRPLLEAKLHEAIRLAREQIAAREVPRLEGK